jgi:predicted phosphodiesterase
VRYAVLADVHANLEALDAVLAAVAASGAARLVCAGDLVGYHADPEACVERLRAASALCVAGNHDRVAAGCDDGRRFGAAARHAALWTRAQLSPESRAFLAALPLHRVVDGRFLVVHGALHPAPNADLHLSRDARVARSIQALRDGPWGVRLAFFGHTHRAVAHEACAGAVRSLEGPVIDLLTRPEARALVNPGSVGQPRDGDLRAASFALLDVTTADAVTVRFERVPFDRDACLAKAVRAGLLAPEGAEPGASRRRSAIARIRSALGRIR